ncbi:oxidoreductase, short chain dehydrogenase/reductase family [Cordyceps fumosorosea ARSEF 2679]|uniref:Oxidoreductase, short chain dehydrogenase/reductase family n=1 Tax=Cordyceps fumosorosea (strain ARSEF 2679) TaxID=1081104 RepID=A0A167UBH1_CORFA|nr:oxidoreductase, short chain dehydrogenase/reductase family [Cordyceps fumosorosea ARSEF 2679]OAA61417.1 oxidoreductase, short chain dehydrogenase/reductase family [Cordyceps fumosorosea ARSEF 2679]
MASPFIIVFAAGDDEVNHQIARQFAPRHPIAFLCPPSHNLAAAVRAAHAAGTEAVLFETDLSSVPSVQSSIAAAAAHFGAQSSAAAAAAIFQVRRTPSAPFLTQTSAQFREETSAQVASAYAFAQGVMPLLTRGAGSGEFPATLAFVGCEGRSRSDAVVEGALVALSRSLGREYGKKYIHVAHLKFGKGSAAEGKVREGEERDVRVAETLWHLYTQPLSCFANELTI